MRMLKTVFTESEFLNRFMSNDQAFRLSKAFERTVISRTPDSVDNGLILRTLLEEEGFFIIDRNEE